jgi:hypothetical protein
MNKIKLQIFKLSNWSVKIFKIELDVDSYRFWGEEPEKIVLTFLKCLELFEK